MRHGFAVPVLSLLIGIELAGQVQQQAETKPVPVMTGYMGLTSTFKPGEQQLVPLVNPILLVPIGRRWLAEAEFELEGGLEREDGEWEREYERGIEYLQVDFLAHRCLTVVAGRFLTPFGAFNERLHPIWIKKLQPNPIIFPLTSGSSNGMMLRGGARVASGVNLTYAGYFSALTTVDMMEAKRSTGSRWSLFLPNRRLELGASFQRVLQDERLNAYGFDATWLVKRLPLEFRTEYARSVKGSGYWVEGAYRLTRRAELVARMEQFFAPARHEDQEEERIEASEPEDAQGDRGAKAPGAHGVLPEIDTQRPMVGFNYYFRDGLKLSFSGGRAFTSRNDRNIWSLGIAYRF